jgi:Zinc carboxypeptidase
MPPKPPVRIRDDDYHFHAYDYTGSAGKGPWKLSDAQPNSPWRFYSLVQDLSGLRAIGRARNVPNIAVIDGLGDTDHGRKTKVLSFGNANQSPTAPSVVLSGGIHAREWIAAEVAYLIAEYLVVNYNQQPNNEYEKLLKSIVDSRNIKIVPMINPDGNIQTMFGINGIDDLSPRMWRKNLRVLPTTAQQWVAILKPGGQLIPPFTWIKILEYTDREAARYGYPEFDPAKGVPPGTPNPGEGELATGKHGVDVNRNFGTRAWGYASGAYQENFAPGDPGYFGPGPASESETGNIQMLLVTNAPRLATTIDYHSFGKCILYPSEVCGASQAPADPGYQQLGKALQQLIGYQDNPDYTLGSPRQGLKYDAAGTLADYAAARQARAFTIEVEPAVSINPKTKELDPAGFLLPEDRIRTVFEKNIRGALLSITAPYPGLQGYGQMIALLAKRLQGWNVYGRGNQLPA